MKAVKTIAALIFLSVLGIVLVQPVLGADDDPKTRTRGRAETSDDPDDTSPGGGEEDDEEVALTARYPKRCMRPSDGAPSGLVAARRGSVADVGFPDERPVARVEVSGDVAWSPSGRFLAERGGRVFDQSGNPHGALFFEPLAWQWSPVADCALATTERGSLTFSIPDSKRKGIRLLNAPVRDFELSPNGRLLAAVVEGDGLYVADLRRRSLTQATEGRASLEGWYSNRAVLFSKSEGEGKLRYATKRGKTGVVRDGFAGGALVRCGGRVLLVSPATKFNQPLVEVTSRRGRLREVLMPPGPEYHGYSSAACSPDGQLIAASAVVSGEKGPLALLAADGTIVRELDTGRTANPQWSEDGLIYVKFGKAGRGRLWLTAPGSAPVPTAYKVGAPNQYDWHAP